MNEVSKHPLLLILITSTITLGTGYFGFVRDSEIRDTVHEAKIEALSAIYTNHEKKDSEQDSKIASVESTLTAYATIPPRVSQLEKLTQSFSTDLNQIKINQSLQKNDADHMMHDLDELKDLLKQALKEKTLD